MALYSSSNAFEVTVEDPATLAASSACTRSVAEGAGAEHLGLLGHRDVPSAAGDARLAETSRG